jgi:hypothetical protein
MGEPTVMSAVKKFVYDPFLKEVEHLNEEVRSIETSNAVALPNESSYTVNSPR